MARPYLRTREKTRLVADIDDLISDSNIRTSITYRSVGAKSFTAGSGHSSSDTDVATYGVKVSIDQHRTDVHQDADYTFIVKALSLSNAGVTPKINDEIIEGSYIYTILRIRYGPSIPWYAFEVAGR